MSLYDSFLYWFHHSKSASDIITGLYSSGIFLLLLSLLKPKIRISDKISFVQNAAGQPGQQKGYWFKVINKSLFFKIYDIQVRAWSTEVIPTSNGDNTAFDGIKIKRDFQWILHRLNPLHIWQDVFMGGKRLKYPTDYAVQFLTYEDLHSMIGQRKYITFELIAKHSLTGFTRVRRKTFKHVNDIVSGEFYSGNSCIIK